MEAAVVAAAVHCLFVDGVLNLCLYLLLETMIGLGHLGIYTAFSVYLSGWTWPCRISSAHLREIFGAAGRTDTELLNTSECKPVMVYQYRALQHFRYEGFLESR